MPNYKDCDFFLTLADGTVKTFKGEDAFKQHLAEGEVHNFKDEVTDKAKMNKAEDRPKLIAEAVKHADEVGGFYKDVFKENPEQAMREAADQLHGDKDEAETARKVFGDKISDIALKLFPKEERMDFSKPVDKDQAKSLADKIRSLKSNPDKLYDAALGIPVAIYDGALELIAKGVEAGKAISDAIKDAVDYIRDNHKEPLQDKDIISALHTSLAEAGLTSDQKIDITRERLKAALETSKKNKNLWQEFKKLGAVEKLKDIIKSGIRAFHAATFEGKELARDTMSLIRKRKGEENRQNEIADFAHRKLMNDWNKVPKIQKLLFILSIENEEKYGNVPSQFKELAKMYRKRMDDVFDVLSKIKNLPYTEDYFPHFWEKPDKVANHFASIHAKSPFEGNKSFLKQRFFADILEGLEAGFKLATDNPEEMVRLAESNAWKFQAAHDVFGEMKSKGLLKYYRTGEQPENWKLVEDPLFKRMTLFTSEEGDAAMSSGGYYMPESVANVVNNYLSRGFSGKGPIAKNLYQGIRAWNNVKNLFQLGLGAFHFTTTTVDTTVTGVGNALSLLSAGKIDGLLQLASSFTVLPNIADTLIKGDKTIKRFRTGLINYEVQGLIDANGRTGLSKIYTLDSYYNMRKAIGKLSADKDFSQLPKIVGNAVLTLPELLAKPLMEWYVPRLKVGGFIKTMETELALRKDLTPDQITKLRQKIWDSMDDRLGQMVYDNIFWDKTMKDLAFMSIRSFGWTGGTIRAFGKGVGEAPESAKRLAKGQGLSPNTAWLLALPVTVGAFGAMYQYAMTGKGPTDWKDYFFPKDGSKNADGTDHRVSLPSYMKDFFSYKNHPVQTLVNKLSPTFNEVANIFNDKDFYGTEIYNKNDNILQKGIDILKYEAESFEPFSFKQQSSEKSTLRQQIEQMFGIMPATKEFQRTDLQNAIAAASAKSFQDEVKTKQDAERIVARRDIRNELYEGKSWNEIPKDLKQKARLTYRGSQQYIRDAKLNPYHRLFRDLGSQQQLEVWSQMKDTDKKEYKEYINKINSFINLAHTKPEFFEDPKIRQAYKEITHHDVPADK